MWDRLSSVMTSLQTFLEHQPCSPTVKQTILALADAAEAIAQLAAQTSLSGHQMAAVTGGNNSDGDSQKQLDVISDDLIFKALKSLPLNSYFSEEQEHAQPINPEGGISVACDPLDGSSNIDTNLTIGTIFSVFPHIGADGPDTGRSQLAAGFFAYGPQTSLFLTCGQGSFGFALTDSGWQAYEGEALMIPARKCEFAINASNQPYWSQPVSAYITSLLANADQNKVNMRWLGSLVADAFRIFRRGGIFLYPADSRPGYEQGRLRLVYEANPIAFLVEQAGGRATDGTTDILDIQAENLHQRVPFIFGSKEEVETFLSFSSEPDVS